jgi:predicted N-formylglutamate amidohydrolase
MTLLTPYSSVAGPPDAGVLVLCDHAGRAIPQEYGSLGLPAGVFERHIAYDIGAAGVSRTLAAALGAPALLANFSRLLIDANRGADDPTLVMRLSDGALVPGNARIGAEEIERRIANWWAPYQKAIAAQIAAMRAAGRPPVLVSIHTFTPAWKSVPRPWHVGVLWDRDARLARPLLDALAQEPGLVVGDNEPYDGALAGDTMFRHGTQNGLAHALIEIRQDLVAEDAHQTEWGLRLARILRPILADPSLHAIEFFGSRTG